MQHNIMRALSCSGHILCISSHKIGSLGWPGFQLTVHKDMYIMQ